MRIIFFGNHDVGIASLETLAHNADVVGVVAHPVDPEEGSRYASLYDFAVKNNLPVIRGTGKEFSVFEFVQRLCPDLIWVTDYRYILPNQLISASKLGAVNLHPGLLPKYRGRAPINWAIINGETKIGLTAHFIDDGIDTGDIIKQLSITLTSDQDIGNAIDALIPQYRRLTKDVLSCFVLGKVPRKKQDHSKGSLFPARTPCDGRIRWTEPAKKICNLIRAVTHPYPGAFCETGTGKIFVWKASVVTLNRIPVAAPGLIIGLNSRNEPIVECGEGFLEIINWTAESKFAGRLDVGVKLI
jgi:methionyl-tRNA formyltransferase